MRYEYNELVPHFCAPMIKKSGREHSSKYCLYNLTMDFNWLIIYFILRNTRFSTSFTKSFFSEGELPTFHNYRKEVCSNFNFGVTFPLLDIIWKSVLFYTSTFLIIFLLINWAPLYKEVLELRRLRIGGKCLYWNFLNIIK